LGLGPFEIAGRIAIQNATLPPAGIAFRLSFGLWLQASASANPAAATNPYQSVFLDYSPDNNSGNLRIATSPGPNVVSTLVYANTTGGFTPAAFHWWSIKVDVSGTITAFLDGVLIGTVVGGAPLGLPMVPLLALNRNASAGTIFNVYWDALYIYESYTR